MDEDREGAKDVDIMVATILSGGHQAGFNTNPKSGSTPNFIEVGGQKIVCIAQGGECRSNYNYYSPGLNDKKSWTTPIIDESCPDHCHYKVLVCDDHGEKCEGSMEYYPQYNKFYGIYRKYCRNFDKYIKKDAGGKRKKKKMMVTEEMGEDGNITITRSYY